MYRWKKVFKMTTNFSLFSNMRLQVICREFSKNSKAITLKKMKHVSTFVKSYWRLLIYIATTLYIETWNQKIFWLTAKVISNSQTSVFQRKSTLSFHLRPRFVDHMHIWLPKCWRRNPMEKALIGMELVQFYMSFWFRFHRISILVKKGYMRIS